MAGTSVSSDRREDLVNEQYVTSEKVDDFVSDHEKHRDFDDSEKTDYVEHDEDFEDSPIEEVRAVVSK